MKAISRGTLDQWADDHDEQVRVMDGLDSALVGVCEAFPGPVIAVYSYRLIIKALRRRGMSRSEADEYFGFNIKAAYVGSNTPAILYDDLDMSRGTI